jgi:hypothetical protein
MQRLVPVDGEVQAAAFRSVDDRWNMTFRTSDGELTIQARDIVFWGAFRDEPESSQVVLSSGCILAADVLSIQDDRLTAWSDLCGEIDLPLSSVRAVVWDPPADPARRDGLLDTIGQAAGTDDLLMLGNGDQLRGMLTAMHEGDEAATDEGPAIDWSTPGRDIRIPIDKALATVFRPDLVPAIGRDDFRVEFGFRDGTLLSVTRVETINGLVRLTTLAGIEFVTDAEALRSELKCLRSYTDRIAYVSDMDPISYRQIPMLDLHWPLGRDRNVLGGRLRSKGAVAAKGLGMHSTALVAYNLAERFRRFEAELALDERADAGGSVIFRVLVPDDAGRWRTVYRSPTIRGTTPIVPVSVDISKAQRMALVVDFADRGGVLDYANWLNARLCIDEGDVR